MISKHIFTSDVVSGKAFWLNNLQSTGNLVTANSNFTITNDATILGDLTVKGSTTTIDTVTLTVDDHNIELGSVDNPTDSTANGGGITLKGAGDKTFNWSSASNAWESNVGLNVLGGNVGIGTTSPSYELEIKDSSNDAYISVVSPNTDNAGILFGDTDASARGGIIYDNDDNSLAFRTNDNTDKMRIDSAGSVGIGTTNPDELLHIANTSGGASLLIETHNSSGGNVLFGDDTSNTVGRIQYLHSDNSMRLSTSGSNSPDMTIDSAGRVGIGTTSPKFGLDIKGKNGIVVRDAQGNNNTQTNIIRSSVSSVTHDDWGVGINVVTEDDASNGYGMAFWTRNRYNGTYSEKMRLDHDGNVGIGTASPNSALHIEGGTNSTSQIRLKNYNNTDDISDFYITPIYNANQLQIRNGSGTSLMTVDGATGNVGIGTTDPDCKLDISTNNTTGLRLINHDSSGANASNDPPAILFQANGWDTNAGSRAYSARIRVNSNYSGAAGRGNTHPVMNFDLETNEDNPDDNLSTKMMINADGNVGIGTTSPGARLNIVDGQSSAESLATGQLVLQNSFTNGGKWGIHTSANGWNVGGDGKLGFYADDNANQARMIITQAGDVGIGTTSPDARLTVAQPGTTIGGNDLTKGCILLGKGSEGIAIDNNEIVKKGPSDTGSLVIGNANANGEILLRTNLQNRLVISNSGASLTGGLTTSGNVSINANIDKVTDIYVQDQIIHHGDTDTYMQFHAADQWRVVAGGSEIIECTNTAFNVAKNTSMAGSLSVAGNLTVNGTTSTINSTTVTVDDKNIELGSVASPTNDTANGGGITLKGATDKTISWNKATTSWDISENLGVADGKYIFTDKVRARDAAGLLLQDDGGNGITINNGGNTSVSHALAVGGNTTIGGNTSIVGTTYLGGAATFNENVTINAAKTLQAGNITVANGKSISTDKIEARDSSGLSLVNDGGEGITISDTEGRVETTASLAVGESLAVAGAANLSSSLQVAGSTTFIGDINSFNNTTANFGGNVNIGGETTFEGATVFQKNVVISGDFNVTSETPMTLEQGQLEIQTLTSAPQNTTNQLYNLNNNIYWNGTNLVTSHPNISAASSSNNSGRTYIQDITVDGNGHVTNIATATETVTNTNTTYSAGDHLNLNSTTFSVKRDLRGSNNGVSNGVYVIGQNFDDYFMVHGVTTNYADWYQGGDLRMRLQSPALTAGSADLHIEGDVLAFSTTVSDKNFKDNINTIDNALYKVNKLRGVEFEWNSTSRKGEKDIGVVAQEVEEVLPEIVREKTPCVGEFCENTEKYKTVDYQKLTAVLIEAVKELSTEVEDLKKKLS